MSDSPGCEKRQFVRVPVDVQVNYRFIRYDGQTGDVFSGKTGNIGAGGLLLTAALPEADLIADLLMGKVSVWVELLLPEQEPIRAISHVAWLEALDETNNTCAMGLRFAEIAAVAQDELFRFVINAVNI